MQSVDDGRHDREPEWKCFVNLSAVDVRVEMLGDRTPGVENTGELKVLLYWAVPCTESTGPNDLSFLSRALETVDQELFKSTYIGAIDREIEHLKARNRAEGHPVPLKEFSKDYRLPYIWVSLPIPFQDGDAVQRLVLWRDAMKKLSAETLIDAAKGWVENGLYEWN